MVTKRSLRQKRHDTTTPLDHHQPAASNLIPHDLSDDTNDMPTYAKNYLRQTHRITAPARQAAQPPRTFGSRMVPANQAEAWQRAPSGSAEIRETAPLHLTRRVFGDSRARRVPHGHGEPGSSPASKFGPRVLPCLPVSARGKPADTAETWEGRERVTPRTRPVGGLDATLPRQGAWIGAGRVLGQRGGRYQE